LQGAHKDQFAFCSESGSQVDYYFIRGNNLDEVIAGYRELTGASCHCAQVGDGPVAEPGALQNAGRDTQHRAAPSARRKYHWTILCSTGRTGKRTTGAARSLMPRALPNPAGMIKTLHEQYNTHFMISVWPKFYEGIPAYESFQQERLAVQTKYLQRSAATGSAKDIRPPFTMLTIPRRVQLSGT
jgi:alpha-D-xyloside xylohydrolase